VTPHRFLASVTAAHARRLLEKSVPVVETALASGLSGPGRLHDLIVGAEAVTPGAIQRRGEALCFVYGVHETPFGSALLVESRRGISGLSFVDEGVELLLADFRARWPRAELVCDPARTAPTMARIVDSLRIGPDGLRLAVAGTNFQLQVWSALLRLPPATAVSYGRIAAHIGRPDAVRAVGSAVGANPVPLLIPCHRVLRSSGAFGGYSGGIWRKRAILAWEQGVP